MADNRTLNFRLRVKFYSSQPSNLKEEITRYYVYLQLKDDVRTGRLVCPDDVAMELGALVLQAELGDYDPSEHSLETVSEFELVPKQSKEIEMGVLEKYKTIKGLSPSQSELTYLNKARWLEAYGVDFHDVTGRDDNNYRLGLVPTGILVFEGNQRIGLFYWPKITRLQFKKRKLILNVVESDDKGIDQEHTFVFRSSSERACKHLWKCAVEHHAFYRLSGPSRPLTVRTPFLRLGSKFRYSGNTELQSLTSTRPRRSVIFERKSSQKRSRPSQSSRTVQGQQRYSSLRLSNQQQQQQQHLQQQQQQYLQQKTATISNVDNSLKPVVNGILKKPSSNVANETINRKIPVNRNSLDAGNGYYMDTNNTQQRQQQQQANKLPAYNEVAAKRSTTGQQQQQHLISSPTLSQQQQQQQQQQQRIMYNSKSQQQQQQLPQQPQQQQNSTQFRKSNLRHSNSHILQQHQQRFRNTSVDSPRVRSYTQFPTALPSTSQLFSTNNNNNANKSTSRYPSNSTMSTFFPTSATSTKMLNFTSNTSTLAKKSPLLNRPLSSYGNMLNNNININNNSLANNFTQGGNRLATTNNDMQYNSTSTLTGSNNNLNNNFVNNNNNLSNNISYNDNNNIVNNFYNNNNNNDNTLTKNSRKSRKTVSAINITRPAPSTTTNNNNNNNNKMLSSDWTKIPAINNNHSAQNTLDRTDGDDDDDDKFYLSPSRNSYHSSLPKKKASMLQKQKRSQTQQNPLLPTSASTSSATKQQQPQQQQHISSMYHSQQLQHSYNPQQQFKQQHLKSSAHQLFPKQPIKSSQSFVDSAYKNSPTSQMQDTSHKQTNQISRSYQQTNGNLRNKTNYTPVFQSPDVDNYEGQSYNVKVGHIDGGLTNQRQAVNRNEVKSVVILTTEV